MGLINQGLTVRSHFLPILNADEVTDVMHDGISAIFSKI